jgi:hypothetical protein
MRRLQALATTSSPPMRPALAHPWPHLRGSSPPVVLAVLLLDVPVVPPGRPAAPSPQQSSGPAVFSLRMAMVALVLFFLPTIMVVVTHAVTLVGQRLATHAARQVSPLWFADAVARGDFTEAELQAARFFQPAKKQGSPGGSQ